LEKSFWELKRFSVEIGVGEALRLKNISAQGNRLRRCYLVKSYAVFADQFASLVVETSLSFTVALREEG